MNLGEVAGKTQRNGRELEKLFNISRKCNKLHRTSMEVESVMNCGLLSH